jgi:hypothetical protein
MGKRRAPTRTEIAATALLQVTRGDGSWLIPEPLRSTGTAEQIVRSVEWDHRHPHAQGGTMDPQNLQPLTKEDHKAKTRRDVSKIARDKRMVKQAEFRRQVLAPNEPVVVRPTKRKSQCEYTRLKPYFKRKVQGGKVVRRET